MSDRTDNKTIGEKPDLVRNYRPVAIRSVVAAHAMIPKARPETAAEPSAAGTGFALPPGFHNPPEE